MTNDEKSEIAEANSDTHLERTLAALADFLRAISDNRRQNRRDHKRGTAKRRAANRRNAHG